MKALSIFVVLLTTTTLLFAQQPVKQDTISPRKGDTDKQLEDIKAKKVRLHSDSLGNEPNASLLVDSAIQNKYGDLLNDDTAYNLRYPFWKPAIEVIAMNALIFSADRYFFKYDYSTSVSLSTWNHNMKTGWAWDSDRFGMNFSSHPYTGSIYFNAGRSNGYGYFGSLCYSLEGSLMWEYFGENTLPSYNDLINTSLNGAFLGEILYRISSNILDDRTKGRERVFREIAAGLIDPMRGFNRLLQGKTLRTTNKEVYAKEPINISLFAGIHSINNGRNTFFQNGTNNPMINLQLDYGNPFEIRDRQPFSFFKVRMEFQSGVGRKVLDNVLGYGILFGKNYQVGNLAMLLGGFQYYDYWDTKSFELISVGFGGGMNTKYPISKTFNLYTGVHLALIPFGANSGILGPNTSEFRDYSYVDGLEGKIESKLVLGKYAELSLIYYQYLMNTYPKVITKDYIPSSNDVAGYNFVGIFKPNITLHIYKSVNIGFEHYIYYNDRYLKGLPATHAVNTEEKIFLLLYMEDSQRRGHYN